ncbi:MAG TPA: magnesium transporter [Rhodospirillaceae bacterium]|nr:magnesium transporter [Rhodospirillaceae bacterium]
MASAGPPPIPKAPLTQPLRRPQERALDESFDLDSGFVESVISALLVQDTEQIQSLVVDLHHADMADLIERLDRDSRRQLVDVVSTDFNANILPELATDVRDEVMDALGFDHLSVTLGELDSDDAVYVAGKLAPDERVKLLERMPLTTRMLIEQGLAYSEDSAGRLMQRELVAVPSYWTVGETIDYLRSTKNVPDKFYAVFVVDPRHRPQGMVELHRVLTSKRPVRMKDIADKGHETIRTDMDREEVAFLFRQRDLTSAPVIDKSGRLIGQITIDDVVDVIDEEAGEDYLKLAGVRAGEDSSLYRTIMATAQSRFLWLFLNLGTAFVASYVIGVFEDSIVKLSALAILMPICASMGGNAGTQTLATIVRSMATRELNASNAIHVAWKELFVGLINGFLFAAITGTLAYLWFGDGPLGMVIGVAMIINLAVAGVVGMAVPLALERIGADPADSATVFVTTVTDIIGFFTFLGMATWILL